MPIEGEDKRVKKEIKTLTFLYLLLLLLLVTSSLFEGIMKTIIYIISIKFISYAW